MALAHGTCSYYVPCRRVRLSPGGEAGQGAEDLEITFAGAWRAKRNMAHVPPVKVETSVVISV